MPLPVRLLARILPVAGVLPVLGIALGLPVLAGCDDAPRDLREWEASDHVQPSQPDPERTAAEPSAPPDPETVRRAVTALWLERCASCHGAEGRGDGAQAPAQIADFTSAEWQASRADADLARAIRMGQGLMPAFGSLINDRGIAVLVDHVRGFGPADSGDDASAADAVE